MGPLAPPLWPEALAPEKDGSFSVHLCFTYIYMYIKIHHLAPYTAIAVISMSDTQMGFCFSV